jgi:hypothetical protein
MAANTHETGAIISDEELETKINFDATVQTLRSTEISVCALSPI